MGKIQTALISVSDKSNLKPLIQILKKYKIKLISSGGTFKEIKKLKYNCQEVSNFTGSKSFLSRPLLGLAFFISAMIEIFFLFLFPINLSENELVFLGHSGLISMQANGQVLREAITAEFVDGKLVRK